MAPSDAHIRCHMILKSRIVYTEMVKLHRSPAHNIINMFHFVSCCFSYSYTAAVSSQSVPKLWNWHSSTRVNDRSVSCPLCRGRTLPNQVAYDNNLQTRADHFRITRGLCLRPKPRPANVTAYWRRERQFSAVGIPGLIIYVSRSGLQLCPD